MPWRVAALEAVEDLEGIAAVSARVPPGVFEKGAGFCPTAVVRAVQTSSAGLQAVKVDEEHPLCVRQQAEMKGFISKTIRS